jgi:glycosyltransferase involved in cell wall biosynthesis
MKITISTFTFYPEFNGVANVSYKQAEYFYNLGYEVHIITRKNIDRDYEDEKITNFIFHEFDIKGNSLVYNFYRGETSKYIQFLENFECDVILFHAWQIWTTDLFYFTNPKKVKYKTIMISHCTGVKTSNTLRDKVNYILFLPYRYIMKKLMQRFDRIITLSDKVDNDRFYDNKMLEKYNLIDRRSVIPNGLEIQTYSIDKVTDILEIYNLEYKQYIICISNYQDIKNQLETLKIYEEFNQDVNIIFIGDYESKYLMLLKEYSEKLNYKQNIKFLVNLSQEDLRVLLYGAKIFLFSSKSECMPLVLLESIGSGVPVISSNIGNADTISGVYTYSSIYDASDMLFDLYNNEESYNKVVVEINENIKRYRWQDTLKKIDLLINSL